jgi:hypothetical protein
MTHSILLSENELAQFHQALVFLDQSFNRMGGPLSRLRNWRARRALGVSVRRRQFNDFTNRFAASHVSLMPPATVTIDSKDVIIVSDALRVWIHVWETITGPKPELREDALVVLPAARGLLERIEVLKEKGRTSCDVRPVP